MTRKEVEELLNLYGSNLSIYNEYYPKLIDSDFGSDCKNPFITRLLKEYYLDNYDLANTGIGLEHVFIVNSDSVKYYTIFDYLDGEFGNTIAGQPAEYYFSDTTLIIGHYEKWFDKALKLPSLPPNAQGMLKPMMQQVLNDMSSTVELTEEQSRRFLTVALSKISGEPLLAAALGCPMFDDVLDMMEKGFSIAAMADTLWFKLAPGQYNRYGNVIVYGQYQYDLYDIFTQDIWKGFVNEN